MSPSWAAQTETFHVERELQTSGGPAHSLVRLLRLMNPVFLSLSLPYVHQNLREFLGYIHHYSMATGHRRRLPGRIVSHPLIERGECTRHPPRCIHVHPLWYFFPCSCQRQF